MSAKADSCLTEDSVLNLVLPAKGVSHIFRQTLTTHTVPETSFSSAAQYLESVKSECVSMYDISWNCMISWDTSGIFDVFCNCLLLQVPEEDAVASA